MSRSIAPGQTVPVPFTLFETPDSTPTVTVYQSTAAGVLSEVTATTAPTVTLLSGLAYHAYYTVPAAAVHGSAYRLLVSVTIDGETTTHWLDGGTVELWASQASVDAVNSKVTSGGVTIVDSVSADGVVKITQGYDYTDSGFASITLREKIAGDWDADKLDADSFGFSARHSDYDDSFAANATLNAADDDGRRSFSVEIAKADIPTRTGFYGWQLWGHFDSPDVDSLILTGILQVKRGRILTT